MNSNENTTQKEDTRKNLYLLALGALGIVYGDIGTSPLYAFRECFAGTHGVPASPGNILGILSLIFWSQILIISVKYLMFLLNADNKGEGGILALLALAFPERKERGHVSRVARIMVAVGIAGAVRQDDNLRLPGGNGLRGDVDVGRACGGGVGVDVRGHRGASIKKRRTGKPRRRSVQTPSPAYFFCFLSASTASAVSQPRL